MPRPFVLGHFGASVVGLSVSAPHDGCEIGLTCSSKHPFVHMVLSLRYAKSCTGRSMGLLRVAGPFTTMT